MIRQVLALVCRVIAFCGAFFLMACQQSLPTAPSELTAGIVIYEHVEYLGKSAYVTHNIVNLKDVSGPCLLRGSSDDVESWDDCISSVRVAPGWRATLYGDDDYKGLPLEVSGDLIDLKRLPGELDLNDGVSSIRIFPPR
jgi:hypothetical protein